MTGRWIGDDGSELPQANLRRRWEAGRCPCCGVPLESRGRPKALAEGVQICGLCAAEHHVERPGELEALLAALAEGAHR